MPEPSLKLDRTRAAVVVVDVQERLLPTMHDSPTLVVRVTQLVKGACLLEVPVLVTEQYPKGLGPTVASILAALPGVSPLEKQAFSCCGADRFVPALRAREVRDVVLCGIEAHVCVCQTALDLLQQGFRVFVVADATASRAPANHALALDRMRQAGAWVISVEMALFEMLGQASGPAFKQILHIIK